MKLVWHKDKTVQKLYREKLERIITSYEAKDLDEIDKNLLKGLYENQVYDVEDGKDRIIMCIKKYILQKVYNMKREHENK